jgi:hypothetical protein
MTLLRPYLITGLDAEGEELLGLPSLDKAFAEDWLQDLLFKHPSILPVAHKEFAPRIPIGREIAATDNLFISPKGLLTIVETKLWRNPEAHRTVVAQILDYARTLAKWDYQKLYDAVQEFMKKKLGEAIPLFKVVENHVKTSDDESLDPMEFRQMVQDGLKTGQFEVLVVLCCHPSSFDEGIQQAEQLARHALELSEKIEFQVQRQVRVLFSVRR